MALTMAPPPELLPDVLPTAALGPTGVPVPAVRAELRRIPDARNLVTVAVCVLQPLAAVGVAVVIDHPLARVAAFVFMARVFACFNILAHEAAHRLLFSRKRVNDWVGRWVLGYPAFVVTDLYRRGHMAHHREEFGPNEPDMNLYQGYPITPDSLRRKLTRDALGRSGWKTVKALGRGLHNPLAAAHARRILYFQVALFGLALAARRPELYVVFWLVPWLTMWRVSNRLRAIAEHGGMERSPDRRRTTHHVRQRPLARFFMVPYNTGWHLAHHTDIAVPFRKLPELQRLLERDGWVVPGLEHPSYLSLWRKLASRPRPAAVSVTAPAVDG